MESAPSIKVFIAEDHGIVREALRALINSCTEFEVVGETNEGSAVLPEVKISKPDVVIMDLSIPGLNGVQCTVKLRQAYPHIKVIMLTAHEEAGYIKESLAAGAKGYVLKRSVASELKTALLVVAKGGMYLDPLVSEKLAELLSEVPNGSSDNAQSKLSEREIQVVTLIAKGMSAKQMSKQLNISAKTIETYKTRSLEKLGFHTRAELVRYALEHGWLE